MLRPEPALISTETLKRIKMVGLKPVWVILLAGIPIALLGVFVETLKFFIGYYPSMIVHELGHMLAGWASGIPSISFFFASFSFASTPSILLLLCLIMAETIVALIVVQKQWHRLLVLIGFLLCAHFYFVFVPERANEFIVFGGMAGEFVLPLCFYLLASVFPTLQTGKWLILHLVCAVSFWTSLLEWVLAFCRLAPFPYPPDSSGAMQLFQNPFVTGQPVGDLDKLIQWYHWTEDSLIEVYFCLALLCLAGYVYGFVLEVRADSRQQAYAD